MKRTMKMVLCMALIACMMLCLVACSSKPTGKYNLVSMEAQGMTMDIEQLKQLYGQDIDMYIEFKSDGTAIMKMDSDTTNMKWADGKIWPEGQEDEKASFTIKGDTLTIEEEGTKMTFKK